MPLRLPGWAAEAWLPGCCLLGCWAAGAAGAAEVSAAAAAVAGATAPAQVVATSLGAGTWVLAVVEVGNLASGEGPTAAATLLSRMVVGWFVGWVAAIVAAAGRAGVGWVQPSRVEAAAGVTAR